LSEDDSVETGRVAARLNGTVEIVLTPGPSCASCGLCSRAKDSDMHLIVKDPGNVDVGQAVRVALPHNSQWRAMFFCFVMPLALFFLGGWIGHTAAALAGVYGAGAVLTAAGAAFAGLAFGYVVARSADRRFSRKVFEETRVEVMPEHL
jgi:positive regulator of sigma E activity